MHEIEIKTNEIYENNGKYIINMALASNDLTIPWQKSFKNKWIPEINIRVTFHDIWDLAQYYATKFINCLNCNIKSLP